MILPYSRHIVLLSKGWYPRPPGGNKKALIFLMAAYSTTDPRFYSDREVWRILVDAVRDVGNMNELCNCMRGWFSGWPGHSNKVEMEEALTTLMSHLAIMDKDKFDFEILPPDQRIIDAMQQLIEEEEKVEAH